MKPFEPARASVLGIRTGIGLGCKHIETYPLRSPLSAKRFKFDNCKLLIIL